MLIWQNHLNKKKKKLKLNDVNCDELNGKDTKIS